MYERFTDRARKVMQLANQESERLGLELVSPEHVLLGLIGEGAGVGFNVLKNLGVDPGEIRAEVERVVQAGSGKKALGKPPQTIPAKRVIESAIEEARSLNQNYVGTEHMLLGLLREQDGLAAQVLGTMNLTFEAARREIINLTARKPNSGPGGQD